jgi:hypothetical protein
MDRREYADAVDAINAMASVKMAMNRHKGRIEDVPTGKLIRALKDEVIELSEIIDGGDMVHIIEEAADIQNFLIGIVQQQIQKYRERKNVNSN